MMGPIRDKYNTPNQSLQQTAAALLVSCCFLSLSAAAAAKLCRSVLFFLIEPTDL